MNPPCHRQGGGGSVAAEIVVAFSTWFPPAVVRELLVIARGNTRGVETFFSLEKCSRCPDAVEMQLTHTALAQILQPVGVTRSIRRENFFFFLNEMYGS